MSATNQTSTIGLSQYISTDKPTYLVDYNGDMLKIDNAIAADRGSIADVNVVAERADGKADTNKSTIDTLNEQINGDPEVPSDTGIAGKVSALEGNVNTINSLIGNGSPTTSDQTLIGAVNALEGAVAPREDGTDLANSYAIGEQFARGGSVYTALTSLTAGTAFASLTLNTDYKVSDTLVEQIENVENDIPTLTNEYTIATMRDAVNVTADGVKTLSVLMDELYAKFGTDVLANLDSSKNPVVVIKQVDFQGGYGNVILCNSFAAYAKTSAGWNRDFIQLEVDATNVTLHFAKLRASSSALYKSVNGTITNLSSEVPANGTNFYLLFTIYNKH